MEAITYRPKHFELPTLKDKTWDYLKKWHLIPVLQHELETLDEMYECEYEMEEVATKGEAFGFYNSILVHMWANDATNEWRDFYDNCKWLFA